MSNVFKSGSLELLEPSEPVQVCNGFALSFIPLFLLMLIYLRTQKENLQNDLLSSSGLCATPNYGNGTLEHILMEMYTADYSLRLFVHFNYSKYRAS